MSCRFALVSAKLPFSQAFERLALPPLLLEEFLLLVPQMLRMGKFALQFTAMLGESGLTKHDEAELGRSRSGLQLLQLRAANLLGPAIELIDQMPHSYHLLIGGAQTQLLLALQALPKMKDGLQGKTKRHISARQAQQSCGSLGQRRGFARLLHKEAMEFRNQG